MDGTVRTFKEAAVLVPVFRNMDGDLILVVIRRSKGGVHGDQLGFPGGKSDRGDASKLETALRECREEIGLPRENITILEELPVLETRSTGFRVFPFLARIVVPKAWQPEEREIAEVLEVNLHDLAKPESYGEFMEQLPGWSKAEPAPYYRIGRYRLWGVSYRILKPILPPILEGSWEI
ncbi:MAG: CoA pyrophosphatase [SAR324 cluster bacterium]|nr:CoA pyrophosphatase [SAR324 cluster bacterium]